MPGRAHPTRIFGSPDGRRETSNVISQQPNRPRSTRLDRMHNRLRSIRRRLFSEPRSPVGVNEIFFPEYKPEGGRKRRRRSRKKGRKSRKSRRRNKRKSRKKRKSRRRKRKSRRKSRRRR